MYVCSCAAVTDHRIRALVETGSATTFKQLCNQTCIAKQCGICAREAKKIFDKAVADKAPDEQVAGDVQVALDAHVALDARVAPTSPCS